MENFNKFLDINFKTIYVDKDLTESVEELQTYIKRLNNCFNSEQDNFADICFCISKIKELFDNYIKSWYGGFETKKARYTFDSLMKNFGLDDTQVSRMLKVYNSFIEIDNGKPIIKKFISDFSKSKLFELLQVPNDQLAIDIENKVLRPNMSVKTIREYVKNYQAQQKQNKKLAEVQDEKQEVQEMEEEIPEAYDPKKHYDFNYFEDKTKSQLLNIVWQKQTEYEKLEKDYKNLKKEKNKK